MDTAKFTSHRQKPVLHTNFSITIGLAIELTMHIHRQPEYITTLEAGTDRQAAAFPNRTKSDQTELSFEREGEESGKESERDPPPIGLDGRLGGAGAGKGSAPPHGCGDITVLSGSDDALWVAVHRAVHLDDSLAAQNDVLRARHVGLPLDFVAHARSMYSPLSCFGGIVAAPLELVLVVVLKT